MPQSSLVRKAVAIDKFISTLGLTPAERSSFVADRLTIEKYLPTAANVLEIGSRPSVSLFIEKRKDESAKHIVLDNDLGDRQRLKELIKMNNLDLQVVPIEEFVDIYSYDTIVIDDIGGEFMEVLKGFPLNIIKMAVVGENDKESHNRDAIFELLTKNGFDRVEIVMEGAGSAGNRDVAVFKRQEKPVVKQVTRLVAKPVVKPVTNRAAKLYVTKPQ